MYELLICSKWMDKVFMQKEHTALKQSISSQIDKSQKEVTILFTDIEDSTQYWHKHGDLAGRLMVDRHNRILFPLVKRYRGRIVKTIGDSIMAMFKRPQDALNAAIAMQQVLRQERENDFDFPIKIRIGIHTGKAIVEHNDVYGDIVNVAARVESQSKGNGIALSSKTLDAIKKDQYVFDKGEGFVPKGKTRKMALFFCRWEDHKSLIKGYTPQTFIPFASKQKVEISLYLITTLAFAYFFFNTYLRYFISDNELISAFILNPKLLITEYSYVLQITGVLLLFGLYKLIRLKSISQRVFKILKGSFVASIVYWIAYLALPQLPEKYLTHAKDVLYKTDNLIVTVLEDGTPLRPFPKESAKSLIKVDQGTLLLLTDVKTVENVVWNKVLIRKGNYGWVKRVRPAAMGVERKRITMTNNFSFYHIDGYMVLLSFFGFIFGYRSFKVKPF